MIERFALRVFTPLALLLAPALSQELPTSGVTGQDYIYATSPAGVSQLFRVNVLRSASPTPIGAPVSRLPSRWAHRRRLLGALETAITSPDRGVLVTPMGNAVGNGALHFVDMRAGITASLVPTANPPGYDLAFSRRLKFVFSAEDNGTGQTLLRGYSFKAPGALTPLTPPTLVVPGSPAAYVNRMGYDPLTLELHVPTSTGIGVVSLSPTAPHMVAGRFFSTAPASPSTNPVSFRRNGLTTWIIGTSTFDPAGSSTPAAAGFFAWDSGSTEGATVFGPVPGEPPKMWVPAVGCEELAVIGDGTDTYVYYLLREPGPGTFFVKPSAVGVVRFLGAAAPAVGTILMPVDVGEPFANPAVSGTRLAFESSFGPPFTNSPPGGGEKICILYSPLDPLGASSTDGVLGNPNPLGGRISTKGMDRPLWSADGTRVFAATSHFPGAPNPGIPGLEVLNVPAEVPLDNFSGPHTTISNLPFPNQSIILPAVFAPRLAQPLALRFSFCGNVFNQGLASVGAPTWGEIGQFQLDPLGFTQSSAIPDFPALLPPSFLDATGSLVPIPANFGARRTAFNLTPALDLQGLVMSAAVGDGIYVQPTGANFLALLMMLPELAPTRVPLPAGWVTTTEFHSF